MKKLYELTPDLKDMFDCPQTVGKITVNHSMRRVCMTLEGWKKYEPNKRGTIDVRRVLVEKTFNVQDN